jgi:voltage-dependent calcium channel T type alpha-1I
MKYQPSRFKVRDKIYTIATSKQFDFFIFACISLNILLLTLTWYGDQKSYEEILSIINKVFTFIYVIEAVIKLVAFGIFYFHDGWNIMDFAVVVTSTMELLIELLAG